MSKRGALVGMAVLVAGSAQAATIDAASIDLNGVLRIETLDPLFEPIPNAVEILALLPRAGAGAPRPRTETAQQAEPADKSKAETPVTDPAPTAPGYEAVNTTGRQTQTSQPEYGAVNSVRPQTPTKPEYQAVNFQGRQVPDKPETPALPETPAAPG